MIEAFAGNRLDIGQVGVPTELFKQETNNIDIKAIALYGSGYLSGVSLCQMESSIKYRKRFKG